ncbi:MAG: oxidoreductase, partial [Gemmatimonadales bacterium]|nr:oxidoreductase [Gemmatimonadales bacterium]
GGSALSRDAGRSWVKLEGPGFNAVSCAGGVNACWAAGTGGRIARLTLPR